ncbi:hypothetical protein GI582_23280 [Sulfitobacter sp. BDSS02]|nr:hypothetical protein [Sulfitobacter sp. BDSS02]MBR9852572.1 hypothetical protein [Paracoccaceae bacterium]
MTDIETLLIAPEEPAVPTVEAQVSRIFDGDGILAKVVVPNWKGRSGSTKTTEVAVRFGFIDAPEMGQPGGQEAKEFLTRLIGGHSLRLAVLTKMDVGSSFDAYGRIVSVPYLTQTYSSADFEDEMGCRHKASTFGGGANVTRNVELEMVLNGWAWVLEHYAPDERYLWALRDAQANRRGIWSANSVEAPWEFKKRSKKAAKSQQEQDFLSALEKPEACPNDGCSGHQVRRNGKFGRFVGCSRYPKCKFSKNSAS